jgi:predicted GNAT superfamily acetyltransferase
VDEHHAAARLLARVWRTPGGQDPLSSETVRAFAHSDNYVAGAFHGDALVGTAVAFRGAGHLHSHITGVDPTCQAGGVGYALKQHQRAWALARGIPEVHWTFDPLVRRNAYFNLHKLGATPTEYLPDFYGAMNDGINTGDASDRLYLVWRLASPRAVAAARGERADVDPAKWLAAGAAVLLDRTGGEDGAPVPGAEVPADGRPALVAVPADIERLRADDRKLAAAWRRSLRHALTAALAAGYEITGLSKDGYYLLAKPSTEDGPVSP